MAHIVKAKTPTVRLATGSSRTTLVVSLNPFGGLLRARGALDTQRSTFLGQASVSRRETSPLSFEPVPISDH